MLEVEGEHEQAAELYIRSAELAVDAPLRLFDGHKRWSAHYACQGRSNAALAWKRAGNYKKAEQLYHEALRLAWAEGEVIRSKGILMVLGNLQTAFVQWNMASDPDCELAETQDAMCAGEVLHDLVIFAELSECEAANLGISRHGVIDRVNKKIFKKNGKKKALDWLTRYIQAESHVAGRRVLWEVVHARQLVNPGHKTIWGKGAGPGPTPKQVKNGARKEAVAQAAILRGRTCGQCGEEESLAKRSSRFKHCPCHEVYYCSCECQKAHWKEHKKTCSHRKK